MTTTRKLKNGRTVRAHSNDGLRKRCDCPRRQWVKCRHAWHGNYSPPGQKEQRISLQKYARKPRSYVMLKTEAEQLYTAWKAALQDGTTVPAVTDAMFMDLCDVYLRDHVQQPQRRAGATAEMARQVKVWRDYFAGQPVSAVTKPTIEAWRRARRATVSKARESVEEILDLRELRQPVPQELLDAARAATTKGGEVGTNRLLTRLRHIFAWGIENGYAESTPFERHGVTVIRANSSVEQPRQRRLEGDEEDRLLKAAGPHLHALIVAALETGMRKGELLGLQWRDVRAGLVILRPEATKSGRGRVVPVSSRLRGVLDMRKSAPDGKEHAPDRYVFGNEVGDRVRSIKTAWRLTCRRANIVGLHFHDLRREAGSRLLEVPGVELHDVRDWLGHKDISQTSTYLSVTAMRLRTVLDRVEESRKPRTTLAQEPPDAETASTGEAAKTLH
jgi:integrase